MRARILAFLVVLMADAALVHTAPWPVVVGCVAYIVLILPTVK